MKFGCTIRIRASDFSLAVLIFLKAVVPYEVIDHFNPLTTNTDTLTCTFMFDRHGSKRVK